MIRRFFIWRAKRKSGRSRYRIDRRTYRGVFSPGFFAHLSESKFWQGEDERLAKKRKRKFRILLVVSILMGLGLIWVLIVSIRALPLF